MLINAGIVDSLVAAALEAVDDTVAIYVAPGMPAPNTEQNPSGLPWFYHRYEQIGLLKFKNDDEPDRAAVRVVIVIEAPGELVIASPYALLTALSTAAGVLAYKQLDTSGLRVTFDGYELKRDYGVAPSGDGSGLMSAMCVINGLATKTS